MDHQWLDEDGPNLPEISDTRLAELMGRLRPVVLKGGTHYEIALPDPRRTAYTWEPKLSRKVEFAPLREVRTDHGCGYHAFFKPSIAEVLSQVPDDLPAEANAFCIDLNQTVGIYKSGDGHRVVTVFGRA